MNLFDLISADQLSWLGSEGYVRCVDHPTEPLTLLNYTDKAQIAPASLWRDQPGLKFCRGLIYDTRNAEIVARPFRKFWNYGQGGADEIALSERVYTIDKVDGSLGIMYREPVGGKLAIATRGSFTSDQALHATNVLRNWYCFDLGNNVPDNLTFLFEIVYPENRIVVNYHDVDDLFLLGAVDLDDGYVFTPSRAAVWLDWTGPRAESLGYNTLADALAAPPRENAEGMVVSTRGGDKMVKIKQEDYIALHKIVTGLSERRVWQALMAGQTIDQILEPLPDEFHPWVKEVGQTLLDQYGERRDLLVASFHTTMNYAFHAGLCGIDADDYGWNGYIVTREQRKDVALLLQEAGPDAWAMFALLDGRDISQKIWKQLEPKGDLRPGNSSKEG